MIHVIASIKVKPESLDPFVEIFRANVPHVLAEAGCLGYEPAMDLDTGLPVQLREPNVVTVLEKWESPEALQAHLAAPHMLAYKERTQSMVESLTIRILSPV